ncbi:MAG TPA: phosphoenolpyruvate carboxykinase [Spirochaetota bacterium]|nr:phosphoenolpyruvate carboxykinase [Spirochaetota bacterium]
MAIANFREIENKIIIHTKGRLCETQEELLQSELFVRVLNRFIEKLGGHQSRLLNIFEGGITEEKIQVLHITLKNLIRLDGSYIPKIVPDAAVFFRDIPLLSDFIENLYNYWRSFERYVICDSEGDTLDRRPYRTFNQTVEKLTALVMSSYRDIQENITGTHPRIYRQLSAGADIAAIGIPRKIPYDEGSFTKLSDIRIIRQMLLNPPLILEPKSNKRTGSFIKIKENPLDLIDINSIEWICYPAKVGVLVINIYFHESFYELGFSLCNLFELADDADLSKKPDAVFLFGVPGNVLDRFDKVPAVFFDDEKDGVMVGACPNRDMFGYFGYLKKMVLTLHNAIMIKRGKLPFHGALVKVLLKGGKESVILVMGDTGAGKSETLEAFRNLGKDYLRDMIIIADDMGSLELKENGEVIAFGTETGAFLRIDDLKPGYAFGQIDRSILMSATKVNARIILPVTTYDTVIKGHRVDMVLYANNYEQVDEDHPIIGKFKSVDEAFHVFREGMVMSKGTTTSTGIVHSYFANIFGPQQYREQHDTLAIRFFNAFFTGGVFVGEMRTRLGISGYEMNGPEEAAMELLKRITAGD